MAMLPWFNQYPYTDFHELNIDWLCSAYKQYHDQLVQFDQRLDNLETDVNERISAMEADITAQDERINTFITTINAEFASFRSEINQQFTDLETSFNERFTTLQTNLEAEISTLEASINQQFADLSSDINDRITAFENEVNQALADLEEDLEATTEFAYDTMASDKLMGTYNYFPVKDVAPWSSENITFQSTAGIILCNGYVNEDQYITIAGGSDSFPAAFKDMPEDMDFLVQLQSFAQQAAGFPELIMIFYVNGVEDRRETFNRNGFFTITELYHRTLSGIKLQWHLETGVTYNVKIRPFIYGAASGGQFAYNMYTLRGFISDWSDRVYKVEIDSDYANSRNIIPQFTDEDIEEDDIRVSGKEILYITGTAASDMVINLSEFTAPVVDTYGTIFIDPEGDHTVYDSIAIDLAVYDPDIDDYVTVATLTPDEYTLIPAYSEPYTSYTMRLRLTAGSYGVNCIPYVSYNKSNKQLEDEASELEDRVQDIEDELMGETTYGPADIVTFTDPVGDVPLKEVAVDIIPNQDLHGYDYPWPAGGNKNLIEVTNGTYAAGADLFNGSVNLPAGTYTLSSSNTASQIAVAGVGSGVMPYTFTLSAAVSNLQIIAVQAGTFNNVQLEAGSSATSFVPYSNVCPISGYTETNVTRTGVNVWGGETMADDCVNAVNNSSYCFKGTDTTGKYVAVAASSAIGVPFFSAFKANTRYTIRLKVSKEGNPTNKTTNLAILYTDGTVTSLSAPNNFSVNNVQEYVAVSTANKTIECIKGAYYSGTTHFYYDNCGVMEGVHTLADFEEYNGNTYTIPFGQSVYGGTLNVTAGDITSTMGYIASYNGETINEPWISSIDRYVPGTTPTTGAEVCYTLSAATTIQVSPIAIKTADPAQQNNIWCDSGNITVLTQSFVEALIEKYTERYLITYDSVAGTVNRTYDEIYEAYVEGRRLCFYDPTAGLVTELNQFDETNGIFHWEYNEFTTTGITFYEMLIDISGVTVNSKAITI